jgi:hypothetical protein
LDQDLRAEKLCVPDYLCLKTQKRYYCGAAALAFGKVWYREKLDIEEFPIHCGANKLDLGALV